jgi:hypothetical protein
MVTYQPCVAPVITFSNPSVNGTTVSVQNLPFSALITNPGNGIALKLNNRLITTFNFDNVTRLLKANLPLIQGTNTIMVTVTNECETTTETITLNYVPQTNGAGDNGGSTENGEQIGKTTVIICHSENGVLTTMEIPITELPAHEAHGDKIGACPDNKGKLDEKPGVKPTETAPKTPTTGRGGL